MALGALFLPPRVGRPADGRGFNTRAKSPGMTATLGPRGLSLTLDVRPGRTVLDGFVAAAQIEAIGAPLRGMADSPQSPNSPSLEKNPLVVDEETYAGHLAPNSGLLPGPKLSAHITSSRQALSPGHSVRSGAGVENLLTAVSGPSIGRTASLLVPHGFWPRCVLGGAMDLSGPSFFEDKLRRSSSLGENFTRLKDKARVLKRHPEACPSRAVSHSATSDAWGTLQEADRKSTEKL